MAKIKSQLEAGKKYVVTSGRVQELQDKGLNDIVDVRYTSRKAMVNQYAGAFGAPYDAGQNNRDVLIPIIEYVTNDAVPMVRAIANGNGFPILLLDHYSKGIIFILTVPDNFSDLSHYRRRWYPALRILYLETSLFAWMAPTRSASSPMTTTHLSWSRIWTIPWLSRYPQQMALPI